MKTERSGVSEKANASDSGRYAETKKLSSRIPAQGSFRWQIILVFVVGFFVLIAVFTAYQVRTESAYLYRDSTDETITLAESLAASSRSWVLANDVAGLQEVVHSLQGHTGLYYAMVVSSSGRVLAHSDATKVGQFVSDEQSLSLINAPPHNRIMIDDASRIDIAVPILIENRLIGWARVAQGREEINGYLHNMMLSSALFVLMALALSLFAALLIANRLGYRIGHLVQVAEAIQAGNYATRANISGADEIARLSNSLNHMLDVLAQDEAQLRSASLYTRSLIEASLDPLVTISAAGKITDVNQATEQVTGRSRSELIGTDFSAYFTEPEQANAGYQQAFLTGPVTDYPLALRHRDGHVTDVLYNASLYRNEAGEVMGVFAAARDITERKKAEFVLRQSEEGLKEAQRIAHLGSWYLDIATNQIFWSEELYKMYGFDPALPPPLYTESMKLFTPESWERLSNAIARATETGIPYELELETVQKDGGRGWMLARGELVRDARGEAVRVRGVAMDITERKQAEESTRLSQARFSTIFKQAPLGIALIDSNTGRLYEVNPRFAQIAGRTIAEMQTIDWMSITHPDDVQEDLDNMALMNAGKIPGFMMDKRYRHPDGSFVWVNMTVTPLNAENNISPRHLCMIADITERKKIEMELSELNNDFVTLLESTGDFIYFKDQDSRIRFCSQTLANITGHPSWRDMIGKNDLEIFPKDTARIYYEEELPIFREGKPLLNKTDPYYDEHGKPGWVNTNKWPVFGDDKKTVVGIFGISRDITELKEAEDKINELNSDLERRVNERTAQLADANKELEAFSYSVSHDLRTPLRAIDGFSLMLLEDYADKLDDEGMRLLNVVRNNTSRMAHLIDDILHFSRVGRIEISFVETDMELMVREILDELAPIVAGRKIQINLGSLPKALCDRAMMHQVIENLLSNAIKFTGKKDDARIDIGGRIEDNQAIYYVKDNGAGFDMQYANKLFGVFQRLHGVDEFEGTGIGLAIVKRIINRHGGTVWAEGKVNEGATIYFSLPVSLQTSSPVPPQAVLPKIQGELK